MPYRVVAARGPEHDMTAAPIYVSHYERRIRLVIDALQADTTDTGTASDDAARQVAARVLYALDHIPETVR
jgi:hypothetical protein